jgi:acetyl esterase/lipase
MPSISPFLRVLPRIALADVTRPRDVREERMRFGRDPHQYLIACLPREDRPAENRPWLYFLHGGGWQEGSPREYAFVGRYLASRGFPTVLGGYRLAPAFRWPAQLQDALAGYETAIAEEPALASRPVVFAGFSAGGQLAAMMALGGAGDPPPHLAGLLALAAPLDLSLYRSSPMIETLTGHGSPWPEADPTTQLLSPPPPTLLVHGARDDTVPLESSRRFAEAAAELAPGSARVLELADAAHVDVLRVFLEDDLPESRAVLQWLRERG